ncbi:arf-GAP with Rho-GAP domain, ANK repeat and PH domain-containing protein 2 [Lissotriton helveticus]
MTSQAKPRVDVRELLTSIHLEMYYTFFQKSGYLTVCDSDEITEEVLKKIGISLTGHRKRILKQLEVIFPKMEEESVSAEGPLTEYSHQGIANSNLVCPNQGCSEVNTKTDTLKKDTNKLTEKPDKISGEKDLTMEKNDTIKQKDEPIGAGNDESLSNGDICKNISNSSICCEETIYLNAKCSEKHNTTDVRQEKEDSHNKPNYSTTTDEASWEYEYSEFANTDQPSEGSFIEFQGEMVVNDLYDGVNKSCKEKYSRPNSGPSRSFILRNRPVPQIPGSSDTAPLLSTLHERSVGLTNRRSDGNPGASAQIYSSNENLPEIDTSYEDFETEFFDTETGEMNEEDALYSTAWKRVTPNLEERYEMAPQEFAPAPSEGPSSESEYSTVAECAHSLKVKSTEPFKSHSFPRDKMQQVTLLSYASLSDGLDQPPENQTLFTQDDTSITPYACYYGSSSKRSKTGWLDKLSPQGNYMFQKRWVRFDGDHLSYYNNEKEVYSKGIIPVSAIKTVHAHGESKFEVVTSQRKFVFRTEKEGDRNDWVSTLQNALKYHANAAHGQPVVPDRCGYLDLKGLKGKLYAALNKNSVMLCKNEQDYKAGIAITNIPLNVANIKHVDRKSFEITTPFKSFSFTADSEKEKQEWIDAVQESIADTLSDYEVAEKIWFNASNRSCADCQASDPDWASVNLCVVICKNCAGPHRSLGPKISKVRSLKLDASIWSNELVELFIVVGNKKANSFWAANLQPEKQLHPESTQDQRQRFITQKYKEGRFRKLLPSSLSQQQLNESLCAAVIKQDLLETMTLVFSGADAICATGDSTHSTPYLLAKKAGQCLQMEFLHHNKFSDYPKCDPAAEIGFHPDSSLSTFLCGFLYKAPSAAKPGPEKKLKEDMNKKWCTLEGGFLSYYENDKTATPNGMIDLREVICLVVDKADSYLNTGAVFTFEIYLSSERAFLFGAESAESRREWTQAVAKHFVPSVAVHFIDRDYDVIGQMFYKDCHSLDQWKKCWFALEKSCLHYCPPEDSTKGDTVHLRRLQELTTSTASQNGNKLDVLLLVEKGRTVYIHGHTKLDFMVWHSAIEKAAGTDGNALQDQQLGSNDVPIIVNSCIAFVTQYGLGSKSLYVANGNPTNIRELLEQFKKDARSVKLRVGQHQLEDVTDVLKRFLFAIDDALLTKELYPYWISVLDIQDEEGRVEKYGNLIQSLSPVNRATLAALIEHLYRVWKCSEINCLAAHNLAMAFSACLFQTEGQHGEEVSVIEDLINNYVQLFQVKEDQVKQMDIENSCITKWKDTQVSQEEDVLIDIYVDKKEPECCVLVKVSPTVEADELTKTVLRLKNITPNTYDIWATFEVIKNGELERPLHYREKVLKAVLQWSSLPEPGSAYLIVKRFQLTDAMKPHQGDVIKAGYLKFKEEPSKLLSGNKFQERYFVLREGKLFLYKDMKNSKPEKFLSVSASTFYLGVKKKTKSTISWGLTALSEKNQWRLSCDEEDIQMEWFISILMAQHDNDIWPPKVDERTVSTKQPYTGVYSTFIQQDQHHVRMREKSTENVDLQTGKMKHGDPWPKEQEDESVSLKQRASLVAHCLERKEDKVRSQAKKHRSIIGLDDLGTQSLKPQQTPTLDSKTQKKKEDKTAEPPMVIKKLPSNVMQELNSVLQKNRTQTGAP